MEAEKVISSFSQSLNAPQSAYYFLTNADMMFPRIRSKENIRLTNANYISLLKDPDRKVREEAFNSYYKTMDFVDNTFASLMYNNVNKLVTEAKLRGYDSARSMELYKDNVSLEVYDNLIDIVHEYLPYLHEYYNFRNEIFGFKEHMYDVYLPTVSEFAKKIPFDEAKETIKTALKPLGDEYIEILNHGLENNWIDVYPKDGKKNGAYSWGDYDSDPFILLNYTDDLDSLFTTAHELGHSMHSYFSRKNNDRIYSEYSIFVAEVASTTNELLMLKHLLKNAKDKNEKLYLMDHYIDSFKSTVFRQTMFAEFEKITHETVENGESLTVDKLNEIYYDLNKKYFGDGVVSDEYIKLEWARIPHFYSNFYVYKYATGFTSAEILSHKILNENGLENYLNFLKDGSNNYPLDQLRSAGCDIANKDNLRLALDVFKKLVEDFKETYKK